ncbi:MAG TPA: NAD(P)H-quinone oxidoreductase [Thermoanaerobaculia bacterium]|jgi:putative PIG3 family NAD(P)H quinone oxidoreductase
MRAATVEGKEFRIADIDRPSSGPNDLRIRVHTTAVNRADLLQRDGKYPPPPGASEIIGMECAGVVIEAGANVRGWSKGDRVMALLAGGGYAEEVVVDAGSAMDVPSVLNDEEAAAIPEVFLTAFSNIFLLARAKRGESILIHGGGSGVGTAATTLCKLNEMRVLVTAGSDEKCAQCIRHGADVAINYRTEDFVEKAKGVDIVLDHIGAKYVVRDLEALGMDGRVVIIGSMGGERNATIDVSRLLAKRQQVIGSTLRARRVEEKAAIVAAFVDRFGSALNDGRIKPVIDRVYELHDVEEAHRRMAGDHFGKVVLRVSR